MSDSIDDLCEYIRSKLSTIDSPTEIVEGNSSASWVSFRERLDELQHLQHRDDPNRQETTPQRRPLDRSGKHPVVD